MNSMVNLLLNKEEHPLQLGESFERHSKASFHTICCGFAAAVTTPLDVAKTRIMLAKTGSRTASGNVLSALQGVWKTQGISGLFAGIVPRISSISLGGFIFLGMYDKIRSLLL